MISSDRRELAVKNAAITIEQVDRDSWRNLASEFADYNYRHVWEFGLACARRVGAVSEHVAVRRGGEVLGIADVRVRTVPVIGTGIAYVSGGPLTRRRSDEADGNALRLCLEALRDDYVRTRGLVLRVLCPLGPAAWNDVACRHLAALGFTTSPWAEGYRSIVVDTTRPLDRILADFSKYWRRNIKRAERRGLTVRVGTDLKYFEPVRTMYKELLDRKRFKVELDADFYGCLQTQLADGDRFVVMLAEAEGEPVGMNVVCALGDTLADLLSATTYTGAKQCAAYLLQWAAIRLAHEMGMRCFDTGGIDPETNSRGYDFKNGTRGEHVSAAGPSELCPPGLRCRLALHGERVYRRFRRRAASGRWANRVHAKGPGSAGNQGSGRGGSQ